MLLGHVRPSSSGSPLGCSRWCQIILGNVLCGVLFPNPSDIVQFQVQICQTGSAVKPFQLSFSFFWVPTFFHFCTNNCLVSSQFIFAFRKYLKNILALFSSGRIAPNNCAIVAGGKPGSEVSCKLQVPHRKLFSFLYWQTPTSRLQTKHKLA